MATIRTLFGTEPILEVQTAKERGLSDQTGLFGLHRDRKPDAGWDEFRWTRIDGGRPETFKEVELNEDLRKIFIEDICAHYPNDKVYEKLKKYDLISTT